MRASGPLPFGLIGELFFALKMVTLLMLTIWTIIKKDDQTMLMHNPPHPGEIIRRQCLEPLGLTVTKAAQGLGVSRNTLSMLLNGRLGISPQMAIRLSKGFGGSPESWLQQQMQYDLWQAQQNDEAIKVQRFVTC